MLGGSFKIGKVWGIEVKVHFFFVLWIAFSLFQTRNFKAELLFQTILFGSVFLHELGHCVAARWVKGEALEIILWPLGGLSRMRTPNTAKAEFISTGAGPAVNLLLALIGFGGVMAIVILNRGHAQDLLNNSPGDGVRLLDLLWQVTFLNALLFTFNVLPAYPMDGGRLMRSTLWPLFGWRSATLVATVTAMVFGLGFVALGALTGQVPALDNFAANYGLSPLFVVLIGIIVIMASYKEFQRARSYRPLPQAWDDTMPWEGPR